MENEEQINLLKAKEALEIIDNIGGMDETILSLHGLTVSEILNPTADTIIILREIQAQLIEEQKANEKTEEKGNIERLDNYL